MTALQNPSAPVATPVPASRPAGAPAPPPQVRRNLSSVRLTDVLSLLGAIAAAVSTTWLLMVLTPITGVLAFVGICYVTFLCFYAALVSMDESSQMVRARLAAAVIHSIAVVTFGV